MRINKKLFSILCLSFLFICVVTLASCGKKEKDDKYKNLVPTNMALGEVYEVKAEEAFEMTSLNESIIKVDGNTLIACKMGEAEINIKINKETLTRKITVGEGMYVNIPSKMVCNTRHRLEVVLNNDTTTDYEVNVEDSSVITYQKGSLVSQKLGTTKITVTCDTYVREYTVEVIDMLSINLETTMRKGEIQTIECTNAQDKKMNDAVLTSSNPEVVKVISLSKIEAVSIGKATLTLRWNGEEQSVTVEVIMNFEYKYQKGLAVNGTSEFRVYMEGVTEFEDFTLVSSDSSVVEVVDKHHLKGLKEGKATITVKLNGYYEDKIEVNVVSMKLLGSEVMKRDGVQFLTVSFSPKGYNENFTFEVEDPTILKVNEKGRIDALKVGKSKVTVHTESGFTDSIEITVEDVFYSITFDINDEDKALMPADYLEKYSKFSIDDLPISLPLLTRNDASFLGWKINDSSSSLDLDKMKFEIPVGTNYDVVLTSNWGLSRLDLSYETNQVIGIGDTVKIIVTPYMVAKNIDVTKLVWSSDNETIATVSDGVVTGVGEGSTLISVYCEDNSNIYASIGVTIKQGVGKMSELLRYFVDNAAAEIIAKNITVTGYQFVYEHRLLGSVTDYLFEPFVVNENYLVPKGMGNRPGEVREKFYIVVHDTASSASTADGLAHAKYIVGGGGGTSWHYTVANDGIYHHIPDNEVAYHAGDGHSSKSEYRLIETGVKATDDKHPKVTITEDGYYALNGVKTTIEAPTNDGKILTTDSINDMGVRVVIQNGYYYMGNTYFNKEYLKISNYGGNMNGIGMETAVNKGSDIYYTWQKTAKLVANLMKTNNLTIDDVKPHHYFSGKPCPATMRSNGFWGKFIELVQFEYDMITKYAGYTVTFKSNDPEYVNNLGRVIKQDVKTRSVSYTITVSKDGKSESITLWTTIPGSSQFAPIVDKGE